MPNIHSDICTLCDKHEVGNLNHSLLHCDYNDGAGIFLVEKLLQLAPNISTENILLLNFEVTDDLKLPAVYLISAILSIRKNGS